MKITAFVPPVIPEEELAGLTRLADDSLGDRHYRFGGGQTPPSIMPSLRCVGGFDDRKVWGSDTYKALLVASPGRGDMVLCATEENYLLMRAHLVKGGAIDTVERPPALVPNKPSTAVVDLRTPEEARSKLDPSDQYGDGLFESPVLSRRIR